jgi:segregation and condensation protein A
LHRALVRLLAPKPVVRVNTDHVAPVRASVAETLEELVERLPAQGKTTFKLLTAGLRERLEVIVYFLAVLELYKRGAVDLQQGGRLAELHITWLGADGEDEVDLSLGGGRSGPVLASVDAPAVDEYEG